MKRNLLVLGLLALSCLALSVGETQAFFGLLNPCNPYSLWNHHNRYVTQITCRPYNAFTPICWGNLVCDGCCPSPCGVASGCLPLNMGAPPWCGNYGMGGMPCMMPGYGPGMGGACGPDGCCASDMSMPPMQMAPPMQMMPPQHAMPMPDVRTAPFSAPMPGTSPYNTPMPGTSPFNAPMPSPAGPGAVGHWPAGSAQAMPWNGVTQASYNPNYYPPAYPGYYPPTSAPMGYYPQPAWPQQQVPYYWYGYGR